MEVIWAFEKLKLQIEPKEVPALAEELLRKEIERNNIESLKSIVIFKQGENCADIYKKHMSKIELEVRCPDYLNICAGLVEATYDHEKVKNRRADSTREFSLPVKQIMFLDQDIFVHYALSQNPRLCPNIASEDNLIELLNITPFVVFHELGHVFCHEIILGPLGALPNQLEHVVEFSSSGFFSEYYASRFACSCLESRQAEFSFYDPEIIIEVDFNTIKKNYIQKTPHDLLHLIEVFPNYVACCDHYKKDIDWETLRRIEGLDDNSRLEILAYMASRCQELFERSQSDNLDKLDRSIRNDLNFTARWIQAF